MGTDDSVITEPESIEDVVASIEAVDSQSVQKSDISESMDHEVESEQSEVMTEEESEPDMDSQDIRKTLTSVQSEDELPWWAILIIALGSAIIMAAIILGVMACHCNDEYMQIRKLMCGCCLSEKDYIRHEYTMLPAKDEDEQMMKASYGAVAGMQDSRGS